MVNGQTIINEIFLFARRILAIEMDLIRFMFFFLLLQIASAKFLFVTSALNIQLDEPEYRIVNHFHAFIIFYWKLVKWKSFCAKKKSIVTHHNHYCKNQIFRYFLDAVGIFYDFSITSHMHSLIVHKTQFSLKIIRVLLLIFAFVFTFTLTKCIVCFWPSHVNDAREASHIRTYPATCRANDIDLLFVWSIDDASFPYPFLDRCCCRRRCRNHQFYVFLPFSELVEIAYSIDFVCVFFFALLSTANTYK